MTVYEHAMIGIDGVLALGLQRRHGWQIAAFAAFAAVLPDFDGLTILAGPYMYAEGHRLWGHNLLVAGLVAAVAGAVAYQTDMVGRIQKFLARRWKVFSFEDGASCSPDAGSRRFSELCLWIEVGIAAAYSHLLADVVFSAGKNLPVWGVPLLWPLSNTAYAYPMLPWGNAGVTIIFVVSMFAMLRWRERVRTIAVVTLSAVIVYIIVCGVYFQPVN